MGGAYLGRSCILMPLEQLMFVESGLELEQRLPEFLDGVEGPYSQQLLLCSVRMSPRPHHCPPAPEQSPLSHLRSRLFLTRQPPGLHGSCTAGHGHAAGRGLRQSPEPAGYSVPGCPGGSALMLHSVSRAGWHECQPRYRQSDPRLRTP